MSYAIIPSHHKGRFVIHDMHVRGFNKHLAHAGRFVTNPDASFKVI
jgi:hypothetical protein